MVSGDTVVVGAYGNDDAGVSSGSAYVYELCVHSNDASTYGRLLFPPLCTLDASALTQDVYDSSAVGINRDAEDTFYLSSAGMNFASVVVDDAIHINGVDSGLGPYDSQLGVPPFVLNVPIEANLVPLPAHNITSQIPMGSSEVVFELLDAEREIYGHTAVYLVRDCGIWVDRNDTDQTRLNWVSHDVEVNGFQSDLDVASGLLSELHADQGFARACDLGSFLNTTQVVDTRPDPPAGEGYYYLVSGTCASPIGYGNSSSGARMGLPPAASCP